MEGRALVGLNEHLGVAVAVGVGGPKNMDVDERGVAGLKAGRVLASAGAPGDVPDPTCCYPAADRIFTTGRFRLAVHRW
jgi:hypothetical protein